MEALALDWLMMNLIRQVVFGTLKEIVLFVIVRLCQGWSVCFCVSSASWFVFANQFASACGFAYACPFAPVGEFAIAEVALAKKALDGH